MVPASIFQRVAPRHLFYLLTAICFLQFHRSIDFHGYLATLQNSFLSDGTAPWAPAGKSVFGSYFQSPILSLLLLPLTALPIWGAKLLWAILNTSLLFIIVHRYMNLTQWDWPRILIFMFVFTQPISDIFISANTNFTLLALLVLGFIQFEKKNLTGDVLGSLAWSLALYVKIIPAYFIIFLFLKKRWRALGLWSAALLFYYLAPFAVFSWDMAGWSLWLQSVKDYPSVLSPGSLSFQGPSSAFYRFIIHSIPSDESYRKILFRSFSILMFLLSIGAAVFMQYRERKTKKHHQFAELFLLAGIFWGAPYPWSLTILFLLPLLGTALQLWSFWTLFEKRLVVACSVVLAIIPKALWPLKVWEGMWGNSLPAFCFIFISLVAVKVLFRHSRHEIRA